MASAAASEAPLDFHRYHREELPPLLRAGRGALAASGARALGSLAFRLPDGDAYTYVPTAAGMDVVAGDAAADTVIELSAELWQNLVRELDAAAGLLYGGRAKCLRGSALRWVAWEPALRAMWSGRPVYHASEVALRDRRGAALDPATAFTLASDREDMAHFLRTAGYLFVRGVFAAGEIAALRAEAEALAGEATEGRQALVVGQERGRRRGAHARDARRGEAAACARCRATRASPPSRTSPTRSSSTASRPPPRRASR